MQERQGHQCLSVNMKVFLTFCILLLSSSVFAKNLPVGLFGFKLFDDKFDYIEDNVVASALGFASKDLDRYLLSASFGEIPKPNSNFDFYFITSLKDENDIIDISSLIINLKSLKEFSYKNKKSYKNCEKIKDNYLNELTILYEDDPLFVDGFSQSFYKLTDNQPLNWFPSNAKNEFIDESSINYSKLIKKINKKVNLVLNLSCRYFPSRAIFTISLRTKEHDEYLKGYYEEMDELEFKDFNLNLDGF